jgi:hypothetical protein
MYLHYTYVGTNVGVDPNANMEEHTMEGMTQNLSDLTRETNIGKIIFHNMFFFTEFCIILFIHV